MFQNEREKPYVDNFAMQLSGVTREWRSFAQICGEQ